MAGSTVTRQRNLRGGTKVKTGCETCRSVVAKHSVPDLHPKTVGPGGNSAAMVLNSQQDKEDQMRRAEAGMQTMYRHGSDL